MWANLAAAKGEEGSAKILNYLGALINSELIAEAEKLARKW